jgi:hypothetical protein
MTRYSLKTNENDFSALQFINVSSKLPVSTFPLAGLAKSNPMVFILPEISGYGRTS